MSFSGLLINYCEKIGCTNDELGKASGVDSSLISRLKKGSRKVSGDSETLKNFVAAYIFLLKKRA